jgi:hypothetical protein
MSLGKGFEFVGVCRNGTQVLREIVPPIDTESTLVLLARMDGFSRLSEQLNLTVAE